MLRVLNWIHSLLHWLNCMPSHSGYRSRLYKYWHTIQSLPTCRTRGRAWHLCSWNASTCEGEELIKVVCRDGWCSWDLMCEFQWITDWYKPLRTHCNGEGYVWLWGDQADCFQILQIVPSVLFWSRCESATNMNLSSDRWQGRYKGSVSC